VEKKEEVIVIDFEKKKADIKRKLFTLNKFYTLEVKKREDAQTKIKNTKYKINTLKIRK